MTGPPVIIVYVCTGRGAHEKTGLEDQPVSSPRPPSGRGRNWISETASYAEYRCPVCGRTIRLGGRSLEGVLAAASVPATGGQDDHLPVQVEADISDPDTPSRMPF